MKRSFINACLRNAAEFFHEQQVVLPPFAWRTPAEWRAHSPEIAEQIACGLGWDVTDFDSGDFARRGLILFTLRNGRPDQPDSRPYAEKIMIVDPDQLTPLHFHWRKIEDIINRGGGTLAVRVYRRTPDEVLDEHTPVAVRVDGVLRELPPGGVVRLHPGESITLTPGVYHEFWGEGARVLVGEVSTINDDRTDNRFLQPLPRFPTIEEDEPPLYLLCMEY